MWSPIAQKITALYFLPLVCASFLSKNICKKQAAMGRFADFIVRENKRFLLLIIQQQTAKSSAEFFCICFNWKTKRKIIQGCDFLLNRRAHAKIQLIWREKKRPKFDIEWLCCNVFNCMVIFSSVRGAEISAWLPKQSGGAVV